MDDDVRAREPRPRRSPLTVDTHLPPNWRTRLLALLNSSRLVDAEVHRFLVAWAKAEGGSAQWNPLNTTQPLMGSTSYNSSAVQNYSKPVVGISATAITLANGRYNSILGALQGGELTASQIVAHCRSEIETWGTNPDTIISILNQ